MPVAEIETEKVDVDALIIRRARWNVTSRAPRAFRIEFCPVPGTLTVEPVPDGAPVEPENRADLSEGDALRAQLQGLSSKMRWMHAPIFEQGYDNL